MITIDPKHMFPQVSPLAGNKPKVGRTVLPQDRPLTAGEWYDKIFLKPQPAPEPTFRREHLSFEL
jgi:hypothetical protein